MKWTVVWQRDARNLLAELWNNGPDRTDIRNAADRIDWILQRAPLDHGESRDENDRIMIEPPLAVYYTVSEPDFMVSVFDVWRWGTTS